MSVILYGYRYSVYTRIVRMALSYKEIAYRYVEMDPFSDEIAPDHSNLHPFGRVPVIRNNDFVLYETTAITRYLDDISAPQMLSPDSVEAKARMVQIISITDSYGYVPMVRQVFAHRVFRPIEGDQPDESVIAAGKNTSRNVCDALEKLVGDDAFLVGANISHADLHLGAMMAYFCATPEGRDVLEHCPRLKRWWQRMADHAVLRDSDPGLPNA
ncbi:glutathione S-transferase family protein [Thalassospira lucentensis]|uniref:glutathione S-transferase family protein n=1 Tax=Thalassospira lucentensis TaxID=168935 RepID=UPI00142D99CC|nr:glutathione S-transferase family protein [Thalassospira lucentensis]NIZ02717.1 glutathione S-transferase family protein [Thalassospira lucentensis]